MENPNPTSILHGLGEEIIRIITPVSICMFLVVLLISSLNSPSSSSSSSSSLTTIATIAYNEQNSDSAWSKFTGALLNALVFVAIVTVVTFLLVLLFYFRCTKFLKLYMGFSAFIVLGFMGGEVCLLLIQNFNFPIDCITFVIVLFNFTVAGVMSVFMFKMPILVCQGYLVLIGMLVAYWFTMLPEWTTWVLLVAMALYDLAAVLLPGGPLKLLVELAMARDEDIPALVYEARPVTPSLRRDRFSAQRPTLNEGPVENSGQRGLWKKMGNSCSNSDSGLNSTLGQLLSLGNHPSSAPNAELESDTSLVIAEEGQYSSESVANSGSELSAPLIRRQVGSLSEIGSLPETERPNNQEERLGMLPESRLGATLPEEQRVEGIGLSSSGGIKLGLGDFIFYSVLVGRAAMYDFMTVYACYLAIIAGLGITLMLLAFYHKALPALPVSISLGVLFYFLTRILLEAFVFQCSVNLLLF